MKAIVCEMCNSNDVVKEDGFYICQNCGTKYTAEDAKKLMVDISGSSVKVDETEKVERYRKLAREARAMRNIHRAGEYYKELVTLCPDDWEATFFSVYCVSASCVLAQITVAAANVGHVAQVAAKKVKNSPVSEQANAYNEITKSVLLLKEAFVKSALEHYQQFSSVDGTYNEYCTRIGAVVQMLLDTANAMIGCGQKDKALEILKVAFNFTDKFVNHEALAKSINALSPGEGNILLAAREKNNKIKKDSKLLTLLICFGVGLGSLLGAFLLGFSGVFAWILRKTPCRSGPAAAAFRRSDCTFRLSGRFHPS